MRKLTAIICMLAVMICTAPAAMASGLTIEKTSPENGATGVPLENMGVKVTFNQEVYNKDYEKTNKAACKLVDENG